MRGSVQFSLTGVSTADGSNRLIFVRYTTDSCARDKRQKQDHCRRRLRWNCQNNTWLTGYASIIRKRRYCLRLLPSCLGQNDSLDEVCGRTKVMFLAMLLPSRRFYMEDELLGTFFADGLRANDINDRMRSVVRQLSNAEKTAVAEYYGAITSGCRRAVVLTDSKMKMSLSGLNNR
jgi:hypothetical protein